VTKTLKYDEENDLYATVEVNEANGQISIVDGERYSQIERFAIIDAAEVEPQVQEAVEQSEEQYRQQYDSYRQQVQNDWYWAVTS
jgi:hypothetical protein